MPTNVIHVSLWNGLFYLLFLCTSNSIEKTNRILPVYIDFVFICELKPIQK